jgi:hypothetical protein
MDVEAHNLWNILPKNSIFILGICGFCESWVCVFVVLLSLKSLFWDMVVSMNLLSIYDTLYRKPIFKQIFCKVKVDSTTNLKNIISRD